MMHVPFGLKALLAGLDFFAVLMGPAVAVVVGVGVVDLRELR